MAIQLKREPSSERITFMCSPSLRGEVKAYAKANGVSESAAIRYILALFFSDEFRNSKVKSNNSKPRRTKKGTTK